MRSTGQNSTVAFADGGAGPLGIHDEAFGNPVEVSAMAWYTAQSAPVRLTQTSVLDVLRELVPSVRAYLHRAVRDPVAQKALLAEILVDLCLLVDVDAPERLPWSRVLPVVRRYLREYNRRAREKSWVSRDVDFDRLAIEDQSTRLEARRLAIREWADSAFSHLTAVQRQTLELYEMDQRSDAGVGLRLRRRHANRRAVDRRSLTFRPANPVMRWMAVYAKAPVAGANRRVKTSQFGGEATREPIAIARRAVVIAVFTDRHRARSLIIP